MRITLNLTYYLQSYIAISRSRDNNDVTKTRTREYFRCQNKSYGDALTPS